MTALSEAGSQTTAVEPSRVAPEMRREEGRRELQPPPQERPRREVNVGNGERVVSLAAGSILAALGIARRSIPGALAAGLGSMLIYRGATGHCSAYGALGVNTAKPAQRKGRAPAEISRQGIHIEQAFLIDKPPEELYRFWRNFGNLPRIMTHVERIDVVDDRRSHWVAKAPQVSARTPPSPPLVRGGKTLEARGGKVIEWDAEITRDEPNRLIAWRSLAGADVDNAGEVRFSPAVGNRGTEVHAFIDYAPTAGRMGGWVSWLLGKAARRLIREDLRNFKHLMETGEIPTITGQPHGTCGGIAESRTT